MHYSYIFEQLYFPKEIKPDKNWWEYEKMNNRGIKVSQTDILIVNSKALSNQVDIRAIEELDKFAKHYTNQAIRNYD